MRSNLRGQTVRPPKPERFQAEFDGDTDRFSDTFIRSGGGGAARLPELQDRGSGRQQILHLMRRVAASCVPIVRPL